MLVDEEDGRSTTASGSFDRLIVGNPVLSGCEMSYRK